LKQPNSSREKTILLLAHLDPHFIGPMFKLKRQRERSLLPFHVNASFDEDTSTQNAIESEN
jgi:hypothetical protein